MALNTLTFKNSPIVLQENCAGWEIIVVEFQPNPHDLPAYYYYIRDKQLEIVADNSKGYGERTPDDALNQAKFIAEQCLTEDEE